MPSTLATNTHHKRKNQTWNSLKELKPRAHDSASAKVKPPKRGVSVSEIFKIGSRGIDLHAASRSNNSKESLKEQEGTGQKAVSIDQSKSQPVTDKQLDRFRKHRTFQMNLLQMGVVDMNLNSVFGWREWDDRDLLEYVSGVVSGNSKEFFAKILPTIANLSSVTHFAEVVKFADDLADWSAHFERYGSKGVHMPKELPAHYHIPGLAGQVAFNVSDALFFISDTIHEHWRLIAEIIQPLEISDPIGALELAELLLIAEAVTERAGGNTALVKSMTADPTVPTAPTEIQLICWRTRAKVLLGERAKDVRPGLLAA